MRDDRVVSSVLYDLNSIVWSFIRADVCAQCIIPTRFSFEIVYKYVLFRAEGHPS